MPAEMGEVAQVNANDGLSLIHIYGKALQGHHVVHALGEDSALAGLAGQLVGVDLSLIHI